MDSPDLTIEVPAPDAAQAKLKTEEEALGGSHFGVARGPAPGDGEPLAPSSGQGSDAPAPGTQADPTPDAPAALASAPAAASAVAAHLGLAGVEAALAGEGEPEHPPLGPPAAPTPAVAPPSGAAGTPAEAGGEEADELAANLLSNMAGWQSELDTFQAALRVCMETRPGPRPAAASPSTLDASGRGAARLQHSGPKGVTGFRGVTQHKRTKRYEANVWMDHKQMYLGAFDVPEQAAHAHDIGALCSGKARPEALNFPLADYETLLPMLHTLPHAQIVGALRSYGRLPTARPSGGVSSGRHYSSASARSSAARRNRVADSDDSEEDGALAPKPRQRRARKPGVSGGRSAQALPPLPPLLAAQARPSPAPRQGAFGGRQGFAACSSSGRDSGATGGADSQPLASDAQHADLQALEAALMGSALAEALAGDRGDELYAPEPPPRSRAKNGARLAAFEGSLCFLMAKSHTLARPPPEEEGAVPRPLHSGPKGQSGFKGVTLYKRCQRYNAHIWLGKQTHIGTFHTAAQAAVAHDVMELWRNPQAQGLNFTAASYEELLPLLRQLSEADALNSLRNYSRSPTSAAAAAAAGVDVNRPRPPPAPRGAGPTAAAAKPSPPPPGPPGPPSLRRRQRKPQPSGGGSGQRSDDSSGGAAAPQRFSAGSRMWYMLEQEKSVDDSEDDSMEEAESGDSDFAPGEGDEDGQQQQPTKRRRSQSPAGEPLGFQPRSTPSVAAALATPVPADQLVVGARPPRPGSSHRWGLAISARGQAAWFGRIDRQRAAVAADLALIWRRCLAAAAGEEPDAKDAAAAFNVPSAGYEQDAALMDQIRRIRSAPQLGQFLAVVVPQDPPATPGTAAAAAAASALGVPGQQGGAALAPPPIAPAPPAPSLLLGARKRKQQALLEEARAAGQQDGGGGADTAAPAAAAGPLAQAAAAMAAADTGDSASMLAALQQLAAAGVGGQLLRDVAAGWEGYPLMQQQDMFGALKLPAASGDWDQLEGRLQVTLDLASLF